MLTRVPTLVLPAVLRVLLPMGCPGCGRPGEPVCDACAAGLRAAPPGPPPPGVDAWAAPFAYEGVAREVVARVKYRGAHAAGPWLAAAMAGALPPGRPDLVTWAPTTATRRRERGFDHAARLAAEVGRRLGAPVRAVLRRAGGPPQTGLPAARRRAGPAFVARRAVSGCVLVCDDVATTGATLAAAAAALRAGGADRVVACTAARTPPPTPP